MVESKVAQFKNEKSFVTFSKISLRSLFKIKGSSFTYTWFKLIDLPQVTDESMFSLEKIISLLNHLLFPINFNYKALVKIQYINNI